MSSWLLTGSSSEFQIVGATAIESDDFLIFFPMNDHCSSIKTSFKVMKGNSWSVTVLFALPRTFTDSRDLSYLVISQPYYMSTIIITVLVLLYLSFCNTVCNCGHANKACCCCCCCCCFPLMCITRGPPSSGCH